MPPSVVWGVGVGLVIAAIDTLSLVLMSMDGPNQWPIADADDLANILLYSLIGYRVGKATGVVREAAEAGVIAGVLVAAVALAVRVVLPPPPVEIPVAYQVVFVVALNIAMGGILAIVAGWLGARAQPDRPTSRR